MELNRKKTMADFLKRIKDSETLKKPTYKEMYDRLANTTEDEDDIHRIVNKFIFEWFPKEDLVEDQSEAGEPDEESSLVGHG